MWLEGHFQSKMKIYLSIYLAYRSYLLTYPIIHSYVCTWIRTFMYMYTMEPKISFILIRVNHETKLVIQCVIQYE